MHVTVSQILFNYHGFDTISNTLGWQTKLSVTEKWLRDQRLAVNYYNAVRRVTLYQPHLVIDSTKMELVASRTRSRGLGAPAHD